MQSSSRLISNNKTSSVDLSEAINSMYRWYEKAQVCYVYLADVSPVTVDWEFRTSRWFSRGWTLQELLAPRTVVFYNRHWDELGTKWSLRDEISRATGITHDQMIDHKRVSIAAKMSWAALRETTRVEDTAYSLLGLFDINMPLLYGEGSKALMRLQHEILQTQENDESIFAWTDSKSYHCGLLAQSPAAFALSDNITPVKNPNPHTGPPIVTKKLLTIDGVDSLSEYQLHDSIYYEKKPSPYGVDSLAQYQPHDFHYYAKKPSPYIILNCVRQGIDSSIIGIELTERDLDYFAMSSSEMLKQRSSYLDYFVRFSPGTLLQCKSFRSSTKPDDPNIFHTTMKVSLDHIPFLPCIQQQQFATILPSLNQHGFAPSENTPRKKDSSSYLRSSPSRQDLRVGKSSLICHLHLLQP